MASSILTSSQSGIISEGGRKVLKTRVQIIGRYLLEPGEVLNSDLAAKLAQKAKASRARLSTQLKLFKAGIRLGERGVFSSMPMEFVDYHRLSDLVSPANHPSVLVMAVKDYEQRCATVLQFKDDVCLRIVVDVINRHRRLLEEDVARMSDLHSVSSTMRNGATSASHRERQQKAGDGRDEEGNWRLADSSTASHSMLDGDYAVIRRSRIRASVESEDKTTDAAKPVQERWEQWQPSQTATQEQQHLRYQKKPQNQQLHHHQLPRQRQELASAVNEALEFDEEETAAIFETAEGPPTLLNELLRRGVPGSIASSGQANGSWRSSAVRISQLPSEFVARARVEPRRVTSAASSSSTDRPASATWAPLDDRLGE